MKKNRKMLSICCLVLALVFYLVAIVGKIGFSMDPVLFVCIGGTLIAAGVLLKQN